MPNAWNKEYLQHWSDPAASCNHAHSLGLAELRGVFLVHLVLDLKLAVAKICNAAFGTQNIHFVADTQRLQVLGDLAAIGKFRMYILEVHFDDEVKVADIIVRGNGSVCTGHDLPIHGC